jgi:hypothetical protein
MAFTEYLSSDHEYGRSNYAPVAVLQIARIFILMYCRWERSVHEKLFNNRCNSLDKISRWENCEDLLSFMEPQDSYSCHLLDHNLSHLNPAVPLVCAPKLSLPSPQPYMYFSCTLRLPLIAIWRCFLVHPYYLFEEPTFWSPALRNLLYHSLLPPPSFNTFSQAPVLIHSVLLPSIIETEQVSSTLN